MIKLFRDYEGLERNGGWTGKLSAEQIWDDCEKTVLLVKAYATNEHLLEALIYMKELYLEEYAKHKEAQSSPAGQEKEEFSLREIGIKIDEIVDNGLEMIHPKTAMWKMYEWLQSPSAKKASERVEGGWSSYEKHIHYLKVVCRMYSKEGSEMLRHIEELEAKLKTPETEVSKWIPKKSEMVIFYGEDWPKVIKILEQKGPEYFYVVDDIGYDEFSVYLNEIKPLP